MDWTALKFRTTVSLRAHRNTTGIFLFLDEILSRIMMCMNINLDLMGVISVHIEKQNHKPRIDRLR